MSNDFLSHADAAQLNRNIILRYVKNQEPVSRTDIWGSMSISRASVTQVIRQLEDVDLIVEAGESRSTSGRNQRFLRFNGNARFMYVFDWTSHLICLVNIGGDILESHKLDFPQNCTPSAFAATITAGLSILRGKRTIPPEQMLGLGLALPGLIDSRHSTVLYSVELGWRDVNIGVLFSDMFGRNIFLERTGNMIALGEVEYGAAKGFHHVMLILLENEGIGASSVVHGDCQHGSNYMYGELGHIKMPSKILCSCGQQGCLEAVVRDHLMRNGGILDEQVMDYIALGVSTTVNLSDPGIVLLSGKLVQKLSAEQEQKLMTCIRTKITNERSRTLIIRMCNAEETMGIKGMSAHVFNSWFSI